MKSNKQACSSTNKPDIFNSKCNLNSKLLIYQKCTTGIHKFRIEKLWKLYRYTQFAITGLDTNSTSVACRSNWLAIKLRWYQKYVATKNLVNLKTKTTSQANESQIPHDTLSQNICPSERSIVWLSNLIIAQYWSMRYICSAFTSNRSDPFTRHWLYIDADICCINVK